MPQISFGNDLVVEPRYENNQLVELRERPDLGKRVTSISLPAYHRVVTQLRPDVSDAERLDARLKLTRAQGEDAERHPDNPNLTKSGFNFAAGKGDEELFIEEQWTSAQQLETARNFVRLHSAKHPAWIDGDDPALVSALRAEFNCGGSDSAVATKGAMPKSNVGRDYVAELIGGRNFGRTTAGGGAVTYTATQMADTGAAFTASTGTPGAPATGSGLVGRMIVAGPSAANGAPLAYGVIRDNTTTAVNIDFWHTIGAPQTVASTPSGVGYAILPAGPPAFWMGLSVATRADAGTNPGDAFLTNDGSTISEIFGASQTGLSRQITAYAHTAGTSTYTVQNTFTQGASDPGSSAVAKVGIFVHAVTAAPTTTTTGLMLWNTNLSSTATLSAVGDNVQITDTITVT